MASSGCFRFSGTKRDKHLRSEHSRELSLFSLIDDDDAVRAAPEKVRKPRPPQSDYQPPNLGKPVKINVPNFADPNRPKTCLEVDFPIVPINALSASKATRASRSTR